MSDLRKILAETNELSLSNNERKDDALCSSLTHVQQSVNQVREDTKQLRVDVRDAVLEIKQQQQVAEQKQQEFRALMDQEVEQQREFRVFMKQVVMKQQQSTELIQNQLQDRLGQHHDAILSLDRRVKSAIQEQRQINAGFATLLHNPENLWSF
eukprot:scpid99846/ scgid27930/ 